MQAQGHAPPLLRLEPLGQSLQVAVPALAAVAQIVVIDHRNFVQPCGAGRHIGQHEREERIQRLVQRPIDRAGRRKPESEPPLLTLRQRHATAGVTKTDRSREAIRVASHFDQGAEHRIRHDRDAMLWSGSDRDDGQRQFRRLLASQVVAQAVLAANRVGPQRYGLGPAVLERKDGLRPPGRRGQGDRQRPLDLAILHERRRGRERPVLDRGDAAAARLDFDAADDLDRNIPRERNSVAQVQRRARLPLNRRLREGELLVRHDPNGWAGRSSRAVQRQLNPRRTPDQSGVAVPGQRTQSIRRLRRACDGCGDRQDGCDCRTRVSVCVHPTVLSW